MSSDIVVVGSCNIDLISYSPTLPKPGETIHGNKFVTGFGGKGANQCVAAAKLGGKVALIARVGDDFWGNGYLEELDKVKVNTKFVQITKGETSGMAQINVDAKGENQIVIVAGANDQLSPADINKAKDMLVKAKVLLLQLETPLETAVAAMKLCEGVSILNGAPAMEMKDCGVITQPTIFCVNEHEASVFAKMPVQTAEDAKKAVTKLLNLGCKSVLLTMGAEGAYYIEKNKPVCHIASPKVKAIDTTGAGDCFIGGLAHMIAYHTGLTMEKKIEAACRLAAVSVTKEGTQRSYSDENELNKILKEMIIK